MTVARLGSVRAAARALGVSEPAVSGAVGALRRELGDDLYIRAGGALELTPGGRRLAIAAGEMLTLADDARRAVRQAGGSQAT
ncbi:MAG: LysR family transcriptional regulator, partial [Mycobacteriales bacterium]